MFAPKVARLQTKAAEHLTSKPAPERSTLVGRRPGHVTSQQALMLQRTIGNQATARLLAHWASRLTGNEPGGDRGQEASENTTARETPRGEVMRMAEPNGSALQPALAVPQNETGLPDNLRFGIEALSGIAMDDVKVHYNSAQPAQLNALAYAQGADIHLAPGQEKHLPHEAWHVVQQAKGRVKPTLRSAEGVVINDDAGLEREADVMGARVAGASHRPSPSQLSRDQAGTEKAHPQRIGRNEPLLQKTRLKYSSCTSGVVQGVWDFWHNKRKLGVEITEEPAGGNNGLADAVATGAWTALPALTKTAHWATVNLPDDTGAVIPWRVAAFTAVPNYFDEGNGRKAEWMKWGSVKLTEDYGEFEWIITHPNAVQPASYYES